MVIYKLPFLSLLRESDRVSPPPVHICFIIGNINELSLFIVGVLMNLPKLSLLQTFTFLLPDYASGISRKKKLIKQ
jgi:hypothetical protein